MIISLRKSLLEDRPPFTYIFSVHNVHPHSSHIMFQVNKYIDDFIENPEAFVSKFKKVGYKYSLCDSFIVGRIN